MNKNTAAESDYCPFLGLSDDPGSLMSYVSSQNHCYRCKPVVAVDLEHQNNYCLDRTFVNCPVYYRPAGGRLPRALRYKGGQSALRRNGMRGLVVGVFVLVAILLAGLFFLSPQLPLIPFSSATPSPLAVQPSATSIVAATDTVPPSPSASAIAPDGTLQPAFSPTVTPFPSLTPTIHMVTPTKTPIAQTPGVPTPTLILSFTPTQTLLRALEVPIGRDGLYLIHRVADGENLDTLVKRYNTSIEAILAVNYSLFVPIRVDTLIIVPLNVTNPEGLPVLEPYQLNESGLTAESLARLRGCDAEAFKSINGLVDGEILKKGDWFLIPHERIR